MFALNNNNNKKKKKLFSQVIVIIDTIVSLKYSSLNTHYFTISYFRVTHLLSLSLSRKFFSTFFAFDWSLDLDTYYWTHSHLKPC